MSKIATLNYDRPAPDGVTGLQRLCEPLLPQIQAALPRVMAGIGPRMVRCLLTECQRTPKLLDCSPRSLIGGLIQVAQLGLELGGPAGQAYLVPFKGSCQLVIGYRGYLALAHRSDRIHAITPRIVRDGDTFEIEYGTAQRLIHKPRSFDAPPTGYYAVVVLNNGGTDFEYRTVKQIEEHRDRYAMSKSPQGFWANNFDEGGLKTCIRYLSKRLPISVEMTSAAALDESADEGIDQNLASNVLIESSEADRPATLRDRLDATKAPQAEGRIFGVDEPDAAELAAQRH